MAIHETIDGYPTFDAIIVGGMDFAPDEVNRLVYKLVNLNLPKRVASITDGTQRHKGNENSAQSLVISLYGKTDFKKIDGKFRKFFDNKFGIHEFQVPELATMKGAMVYYAPSSYKSEEDLESVPTHVFYEALRESKSSYVLKDVELVCTRDRRLFLSEEVAKAKILEYPPKYSSNRLESLEKIFTDTIFEKLWQDYKTRSFRREIKHVA